jgi:dolichyl-phosphate beta-glucosyltransferase
LYPAWIVRIADQLDWTIEGLNEENNKPSSSLSSQQQPVLSLIIPAYNEEDRISIMLREAHTFLISQQGQQLLLQMLQLQHKGTTTTKITDDNSNTAVIEWIIVNDGSKDQTCQVVKDTYKEMMATAPKTATSKDGSAQQPQQPHVGKLVSLRRNSGKGAAVKTGMNVSTGLYRLMVDADGATDFGPGLQNLIDAIEKKNQQQQQQQQGNESNTNHTNKMIVAFGSRAHLQDRSTAQRSFVRTLLMKAFHFFVSFLVSSKIHDTQCGFKLFTQDSSRVIFDTLHLQRWAFDTEIVLLCNEYNIPILEVGVPWEEVDGSKLSTSKLALAVVSITMLRDMICIRTCYTLGIWKVVQQQQQQQQQRKIINAASNKKQK